MRFLIFVLTLISSALPIAPSSADDGKLVHVVRFIDYKLGSIDDWLQGKGFQFKQDSQRRDRIDLDVEPSGLVV